MSTLNTCTFSTRPSNPTAGSLFFETDTSKMILWDGSAWSEYNPDSSTVAGDWIIVKDNWKDFGRPSITSMWDATRIDIQGASCGFGYVTSGSGLTQITNYSNYDVQDTTSEYNLSSFQSAGPDDIIIDAIRFRCKRPSGGLGYFSVGKLFFVKGAGTYNRNTPPVRNWFSGMNANQGSTTVAEVSENWLSYLNQYENYVWGYRGHSQLQTDDIIGSQFNTTSTDYTWSGSNHMYSGDHIVESDPFGSLDSKTSGSKWMIVTGYGQRQDEDDGITFTTILNSPIASYKFSQQYSYGISAGISSPSELYFTLFFAEPLNFTNLEAMHYNLECDQMDSEVSFEFRKHS